jgi:Ca2+-binding EF-hand superfamily protein
LVDHPDGKISKEQFLNGKQDLKLWNHLFNAYNPVNSELTFHQFVVCVDMLNSDYISLDELAWFLN